MDTTASLRNELADCLEWGDLRNPELFRVAREIVDLHGKWSPSNNTPAGDSESAAPKRDVPVNPNSARPRIDIFAPTLLRHAPSPDSLSHPIDSIDLVPSWITGILHLCLYADKLWVPDPTEIVARQIAARTDADIVPRFERLGVHEPISILDGDSIIIHKPLRDHPVLQTIHRVFTDTSKERAHESNTAVRAMYALRALQPLIDSGTIQLYPPIASYMRWVAQPLFGEQRFFTQDELATAWPELYVAEGVLYANKFAACYTALQQDEFDALKNASENIKALDLENKLGVASKRIFACLPRWKLPSFWSLDASVLVKMRENESAFEDFRALIREMTEKLPAGLEDPDFESEARRLETDHVTPTLAKLVEQLNGISALRTHARAAGMDFVAGALAGLVLTGELSPSMLTGTVNVLAKTLLKIFAQREPIRPAASVVYSFQTGNRMGKFVGVDVPHRAYQRRV
jgi:hypothetical protein